MTVNITQHGSGERGEMSFQVLMADNRVVMVQAVSGVHAAMRATNLLKVNVKGVCQINSPYRSV
jgi:hypothetical protein